MFPSERIIIKRNKKEISEKSLDNVSFSSNNSFYQKLDLQTKRDIISLIKSGYNKNTIIKLYILAKPSNINEAFNFLTQENGIYQHLFFNSPNKEDFCEICGEKKSLHIKEINNISNSLSFSFYSKNSNYNKIEEKLNIYKIKAKEIKSNKCKICEEEISREEEMKNKCEQCNNYFCSECLYMYIKELIRNGKYTLFCPECGFVYKKDKIEEILLFNIKNKEEINNLKKLLEKSNTKEIVLSNQELMFCPIVNCDGFAKKNKNKEYNVCTMGHKFCIKCGELWHEDGKCKEEKEIDELFQKYRKKYNLKNCPYCHIVIIKNEGCNHMTCSYCGKDWCWLCQELFDSTEEHYGNRRSNCYNKMNDDNDVVICSKCENEINEEQRLRRFRCGHIFCRNCFIESLLQNRTMIIFPDKLKECIILGCNGYLIYRGVSLVQFIEDSNNEKLIKKYKASILFHKYFLYPFSQYSYRVYIDILANFYDLIANLFGFCEKYEKLYIIIEILGVVFGLIFFLIYIILVPISIHYMVKHLYYFKFIPEIKYQYNNKLIFVSIALGEELLSLIFLFSLIACHFIYTFLFFPILGLILMIRNIIYKNPFCCFDF